MCDNYYVPDACKWSIAIYPNDVRLTQFCVCVFFFYFPAIQIMCVEATKSKTTIGDTLMHIKITKCDKQKNEIPLFGFKHFVYV